MGKPLKILLVSPEIQPFAKTGGLADMCASLAKSLHSLGHDVRLFMPKYKQADEKKFSLQSLPVKLSIPVGEKNIAGEIFSGKLEDGAPVYFLGNDFYFNRNSLYGDEDEVFTDNAERFIFFCRAVLEFCKSLAFQPDVVHCNEWQCGLIPVYLKTLYSHDAFYKSARTVFSIHNLGYQGNFKAETLDIARLPEEVFTPEKAEYYGEFSFLKAALVYSDSLTTVSPSYSKEILTKEYGFGMEGVLKKRENDLHGILNGVDYLEWSPEKDPLIAKTYEPSDLDGKEACRSALLKRFSSTSGNKQPVLCMVSRLSYQKGVDLVIEALPSLLKTGLKFVVLGIGEHRYENELQKLSVRYPGNCLCLFKFDERLAHEIIAGSDMILIPSRYEPCGLTQIYGMKYGTIPIGRAVGGLKDSIEEFDLKTGQGTGFKFDAFDLDAFLAAIKRALSAFKNQKSWNRLTLNGMQRDFSWNQSALAYVRLYENLLNK